MIMGDFNAHLGNESGKCTFHEKTNKNGSIMKDFVQENVLIVTNTSFQKKEGKLWTLYQTSGHKCGLHLSEQEMEELCEELRNL